MEKSLVIKREERKKKKRPNRCLDTLSHVLKQELARIERGLD